MVSEDMKPALADALDLELDLDPGPEGPGIALAKDLTEGLAEALSSAAASPIPTVGEEQVLTSLVERKRVAAPSPSSPVVRDLPLTPPPSRTQSRPLGTIGPYGLVRELVRAPAAWLVEAIDNSGERVILQLARLRAVKSNAERFERQYFEQMVADMTASLATEADVAVKAHGGADRADGTRVLFWVLPWREDARRLGQSSERIISARHLATVGLSLARRLARRHALGRVEPLLSEHMALIPADGLGAELLGVPIFLAPGWLESDMLPSRLAPEEFLSSVPREAGDVWRLGQTLSALAAELENLPPSLAKCIDELTNADPVRRIKRATDAVVELEAVEGALAVHVELELEPPLAPDLGSATVSLDALAPDILSSLLLASAGDSTRFEAALPFGLVHDRAEAARRVEQDPAESSEVPRHVLAELKSEAELEASIAHPLPLVSTSSDEELLDAVDPALMGALTTMDRCATPLAVEEEKTEVPPPRIAEPSSPWSEVVKAGAIEPRREERAAAFSEDLRFRTSEQASDRLDANAAPTDDLDPELRAALPSHERVVVAVLIALALLGGLVFAVRALFGA